MHLRQNITNKLLSYIDVMLITIYNITSNVEGVKIVSKVSKKIVYIVAGVILITLFGYIIYATQSVKKVDMNYTDFINHVNNKEVEKVILKESSTIDVILKNVDRTKYIVPNPRTQEFKEFLLLNQIEVTEDDYTNVSQIIQSLIFLGVMIGAFWYIQKRMMGKNSNSSMKLECAEASDNTVLFENMAGNEEAKESVKDIVDFIENPDKYTKYGARMPRGVIFYGPPGTGKTLMAKAIAGESGVPFYSVSGSDFVQMYVGVGASRVRQLFKKARESKKAVIFIDEIDALGRKRGNQASSNDERDQTLNALLTEMSGFHSGEGIVVIAATNRLDILDSALLRPGRFDRQVEIGLPDVNAREMILRLHCKNKPLSSDIDLRKLAHETVYFSGAMLENLLNEAAIFAAKDNNKIINSKHIDKAYYTIVAGSEKKDRSSIREIDREITAYHEAGHALMTKLIAPLHKVSKVTIIPSSKGAGGFSMNIPPDKMYITKKDMEASIMISLAGRASEEIIFGEDEITTGASNDIEKATQMIKDYVSKYGMSNNIGLLNMSILTHEKDTQKDTINECRERINSLYEKSKNLLIENKYYLNAITGALLDKETLLENDIDSILNDTYVTQEDESIESSVKPANKRRIFSHRKSSKHSYFNI